jgi:selenide,water dikinase
MPTHNAWVRKHFARVLAQRGVQVHTGADVREVTAGSLTTAAGQTVAGRRDRLGHAGRWPRLAARHGPGAGRQRLCEVNDHLQSVSDAVHLCGGRRGRLRPRPLEKAGVFAVRMGRRWPTTCAAARAASRCKPLPPANALAGPDQHRRPVRGGLARPGAAGSGFAVNGSGAGRTGSTARFMQRFSQFPEMDAQRSAAVAAPQLALTADESQQAISAIAMRCGGCGAKVGATVLSRALGALHPVDRDDVVIGLHAPDDAAVVRVPPRQGHGAHGGLFSAPSLTTLTCLARWPPTMRWATCLPWAASRSRPPPWSRCRRGWSPRWKTCCSR